MRCDQVPIEVDDFCGMDFRASAEYLPEQKCCERKDVEKKCTTSTAMHTCKSGTTVAVANKPGQTVVAGGQFAFNFNKSK